jgi:penicillin-binding protein 1A
VIRVRKSPIRSYARFLRFLNALVLIFCFIGTGLMAGGLLGIRALLPDAEDLEAYRPRLTTTIYSTEIAPDAKVSHTLLGRVAKEDRQPVELQDIPLHLQQATIAIEDRPFYQHRGVDPKGILRAALVNLRRGGIYQGGSTITQQLVRNMWLSRRRTIDRKIKEMILALEMERRYSKDEILEMYLNQVYFGHGAWGAQVASQLYFDKDVRKLSLAEAALLAGLPRAPISTSPYRHPQEAKTRRRHVLHAMVELEMITTQQATEADRHQIQANLAPLKERGTKAFRAPYFTHLVVRQLREQYGVDVLYEGGLRVYTTLDMRLQQAAEEELTKQVESLRKRGQIKGGLVGQGALACVEVATGDVLAMAGGVGPYDDVQFNRAYPGPPQYGRQPGSSFKPYVWAAALEKGYGPNSSFSGSAISVRIGPGKYWQPKNYSPRQGGNYTLRAALAASVNLVSVRIVQKLGAKTVQKAAVEMLGLPEHRLRAVPAIALGTSELAPLEQAIGYCTFASGGFQTSPRFVREIDNARGDPILMLKPQRKRVIKQATAISMVSMMRTVVTSGTGRRAAVSGHNDICGKTGTTQDGRDAWWVGYSPDLSCAVWIGNDDYKPMRGSTGGGFCGPVFAKFMARALELRGCNGKYPEGKGAIATQRGDTEKEEEEKDDEKTTTISVCSESGGLATPYCPNTYERTLAAGEKPPGSCRLHGPASSRRSTSPGEAPAGPSPGEGGGTTTLTICAGSGQLAGPYCPQTVERTFPAGQGPSGVCTMHGPPSTPASSPDKPPPAPDHKPDTGPAKPPTGADTAPTRPVPDAGGTTTDKPPKPTPTD